MEGFAITGFHKTIISALAVRLVLKIGLRYYDHIHSIYVFEREFETTENVSFVNGIVHVSGLLGLSWTAIVDGLKNPTDGKCVVYHEFAHALDLFDGSFDGIPNFYNSDAIRPLISKIVEEHLDFLDHYEDWHTFVYKYKVKDTAEFFATLTEIYFECPGLLKKKNESLYNLFKKIYQYEPAATR